MEAYWWINKFMLIVSICMVILVVLHIKGLIARIIVTVAYGKLTQHKQMY